ncbi:MAG: hypothetical protein ACXW4B_05410 [Micavibrio sp.]
MSDDPDYNAEDEEKEPVDPAILERALERMKAAARGNGIDPDTITLENFEGEVLHFGARSLFEIKPTVAEKSMPGKEQGEVCASEGDLKSKIQQNIEKTTLNKDIIGYVSDVLKKRADKGFFINNLIVKLERLNKHFVFYNSCTSCQAGKIICMACQGAGMTNCPRCQTHRTIKCPMCRGTGTGRQKDGSMGTCRKCNGQREAPCTFCRATGKIKCNPCQGSGRVPCQKCQATGIISEMAFVSFEAKTHFTYESEDLPPDVVVLIDQLGPALAIKEHADIEILKEKEQAYAQKEYQITEKVKTRDELVVPYYVRLPWGEIRFKMGETEMNGNLFGLHPRLLNLPPFLEGPIGPGLDRLTQAANNLGNVRANVTEAIRFQAIGESLIAVATLPPKKAVVAIRRHWSLGLRPDVTAKMAMLAEAAFQNLSKKSRLFGLAGGLALGAGFYALYLLGPLRLMAKAQGLHPYALIALDVVLVATAGYAATLISQLATKRSLSSLFEKILPPDKAKKIIPRAGKTGLMAYLGAAVLFAAMLGLTAYLGKPLPEWMEMVMEKIQ